MAFLVKNSQFLQLVPLRLFASYNRILPNKKMRNANSTLINIKNTGFVQPKCQYIPMDNVEQKIAEICETQNIPDTFIDSKQKFTFLNECFKTFTHSVPNSCLNEMKTIDDVINFYVTPVESITPIEKMANGTNMPKNLFLIKDYTRFHPETDEMFGGQTAFPKSSTLISSLKYRKKFQGHQVKKSWP